MLTLGIILLVLGWCLKADHHCCHIGERAQTAGLILIVLDLIIAAVVLMPMWLNRLGMAGLRDLW